MSIEVIKPGAFSTFQDLGRHGSQHLGIPVGGVMDEVSHRLVNLAVGNEAYEATLEITMSGPTLLFHEPCTIAWGGADFSPSLNCIPVPRLTPTSVYAGDTLRFGIRRIGLRAYLAISGGFVLQNILGSTSTYPRVGFGGHEGRALRKEDLIQIKPAPSAPILRNMADWLSDHPDFKGMVDSIHYSSLPIHLLKGREWAQFTRSSQKRLLSEPFRLSPASDRMGYRLDGPSLGRHVTQDMLSGPVAFGTMQVPPDGQAIILMAERQSIGGYPRIAQVVSVDLPRLAQSVPGDSLHFTLIDMAAAQEMLLLRARIFSEAALWDGREETLCSNWT